MTITTVPAPLTMYRGDRELLTVNITGLTATQLGAGAEARFTARLRAGAPVLLSYSTPINLFFPLDGTGIGFAADTSGILWPQGGNPGVTINPTTTSVSIVVEAADTQNFPNEKIGLVFDLEVSPNDGSGPNTVTQGRLVVYPDMAR